MRIFDQKILEVAIGRRLQTFARFLLFAYVIETKKSILNSILTYFKMDPRDDILNNAINKDDVFIVDCRNPGKD